MSRKLQADLLLAGCALAWGATFVVVKAALSDSSAFVFLALRFVLAAVLLAPVYWRELRHADAGAMRASAIMGFLMYSGFALQTVGLEFTTPSKSAFITGFFVVLVPLFLGLFGKRISLWTWAGVFAAVAGLYFLAVPATGFSDLNIGDILTLICAGTYALHIISIGHFAPRYSGGLLVFLQVAFAAILSALAVPVWALAGWETPRLIWTPEVIWGVLATGVLATAVAFSAQLWAQKYAAPSHVALLLSLEPVFAGLASYMFAGERLGSRALMGAALILAGILLAELLGTSEIIPANQ